MEKYLLKLLDLFTGVFKLLKVDYEQLRAIVAIKLTMDNRRNRIGQRRNGKHETTNAFLWTMFFYILFGVFVAMALMMVPSFIISMIIFFSYIMVMIAMTLITDFSSVLLDTSDNTIVLPRPVDSRTLFLARITHIMLYLGQLTFGLSLLPIMVVAVKYGIVIFLFFLLTILLSVCAALLFTNAFYLLIMQYASEEKLKNIINFFQIVMAVVIMGGYQIMPRMVNHLDLGDQAFTLEWWSYLAPPVWMGGLLEMIHYNLYDGKHFALSALAVVVPLTGFYYVNRYLTPAFTRKLGVLGSNAEESRRRITRGKNDIAGKISRWITSSYFERASFELIYKILGRDRKIKLKIYPSFGYIIVLAVIFFVRSQEDFITTWKNLPNTEYYLILLYLTFMILQVALHEISFSDDFKASWIYFSTPLDQPGQILSGVVKAIFVRLFIPGYLLISVFVLFVWGIKALDDILFGLFNNYLMLMTLALLGKKHLPLSIAPSVSGQTGNFLRGILTLMLITALGLGHYLLSTRPVLLLGSIPVQVLILYFMSGFYKKLPWQKISS